MIMCMCLSYYSFIIYSENLCIVLKMHSYFHRLFSPMPLRPRRSARPKRTEVSKKGWSKCQWIGFRENLQESPTVNWKNLFGFRSFRWRFSIEHEIARKKKRGMFMTFHDHVSPQMMVYACFTCFISATIVRGNHSMQWFVSFHRHP